MRQGRSGKHVTISSEVYRENSIWLGLLCFTVLYRTFPRGMHLQLFQTPRKAELCSPTQIEFLWAGHIQWEELEASVRSSIHGCWLFHTYRYHLGVFHETFSFPAASNQFWLMGMRQVMPSFFTHKWRLEKLLGLLAEVSWSFALFPRSQYLAIILALCWKKSPIN